MGMAVAILGVTNSASLRVLAKSETQQTTRGALIKVLDNISNAESLDVCKVAKIKMRKKPFSLIRIGLDWIQSNVRKLRHLVLLLLGLNQIECAFMTRRKRVKWQSSIVLLEVEIQLL